MSQTDAKQRKLTPPGLAWESGDTPLATRFGDVYFSRGDGLAEKRHVFLGGCGLPKAWRDRPRFTICELGFGAGLTFLATCDLWRRARSRGTLHYIAVEGHPLAPAELDACLAPWREVAEDAAALRAVYPDPQPGFHRLFPRIPGVVLTLLCGDAAAMLAQLEAAVDAWYLDGFAPDRNPDMWSDAVFGEMARLSRPETRLATYTAAGDVRRRLSDAGFTVERAPGYGRKQEMLRGYFSGAARIPEQPWFAPANPVGPGHAAIIGGGIAGTSLAQALRRRGWRATVIARGASLADEASGNPVGITMPRLTAAADALDGRFHATAWRYAQQTWKELETPAPFFNPCGLLQLATDVAEAARVAAIAANGLLPETAAQTIDSTAAGDIAGYTLPYSALYFPRGGWLHPRELCAAAAAEADMIVGKEVTGLVRTGGGWTVMSGDAPICSADIVILANARGAAAFPQSRWLGLEGRRGQITFVPATPASAALRAVLAYGGYLTPADGRLHGLGATFDRVSSDAEGHHPRDDDHIRNLEALHQVLPEILSGTAVGDLSGRAAVRCTSPDHLPLAGPLPDADAYARDYATLHHGRHWQRYPDATYQSGLYVMTALGAHGLTTGPLTAEVVASHIAGDPWPLERELIAALHPGRFLIRALKRPQ